MAGSADFHLYPGGQFGGNTQPRAEDLQDERVARAGDLHAAPHTNAQRLEALGFFVIGGDAAYHGAGSRRQFVQSHGGNRLFNRSHNNDKINVLKSMSNSTQATVDAKKACLTSNHK
jgi:hypothetical protein